MTTVFRWMIDWAADSDPNSMTTGFRWITDSSGPANRNRCRLDFQLRWRIDWAADSDPNSMTFRLGWMMDWAADSDPNSMTTGFGCQWIRHGLGLGRRTEFHDSDDWISSRMEESLNSDPNSTTTVQVFRWMIPMARDRRLAGGLPVGRRTESDVDWISMEDRLGH